MNKTKTLIILFIATTHLLSFHGDALAGFELPSIEATEAGPNGSTFVAGLTCAGIMTFGVIKLSAMSDAAGEKRKEELKRLSLYLKSRPSSMSREVLLAKGIFWRQLKTEIKLNEQELMAIQHAFDGSLQQKKILHTLNSDLSLKQAAIFSSELASVMRIALGDKRAKELALIPASVENEQKQSG